MPDFPDLFNAIPDAVVAVDAAGTIVLVNHQAEHLFGYPRVDLIGYPVEVLLPERFHPLHHEHRADYMRDPRMRPMGIGLDLIGRRRDGTEFPVEISLSPMDEEDQLLVLAVVRDL